LKKGINIGSFAGGMSSNECIMLAKRTGFDGIELGLNETGELSLESTEKELVKIRSFAEDQGIELPSLTTGLYWSYSLTSNDKEVRNKAMDVVKKQLETASILGADTILVVPGAVGVDFIPDSEVVEYDVAYEYSLEALSKLKNDVESIGINIGLENVWNKFLLSPLEMREFIDKIGSKYIGIYLDVGNVVYSGYPEHWVKIMGERIKKVHLKDYRREVGSIAGFVDLLAGDVDYPKVVNELNKVGYCGYLTAEMIPPYKYYPEQIIFNTYHSMSRIIGK